MEYEIGPDEQVSSAVTRAVSAVEGREPAALPSLTDVLDTEAMDALFDTRSGDTQSIGARLEFFFSDSRVIIDNGECLTIQPVDSAWRAPIRTEAAVRGENGVEDEREQPSRPRTQPGSRVCIVCQQPIDPHEMQRERGELIHPECRAEWRCGVSLRDPTRQ